MATKDASSVPPHLAWTGGNRAVDLTPDDFEAMDVALSLIPELRLVALAIRRARRTGLTYPLTSPDQLKQLLGGKRKLVAAGHHIDAKSIRRYLIADDFPIENEGELASIVYIALNRCFRHEEIRLELEAYEQELHKNFVRVKGGA